MRRGMKSSLGLTAKILIILILPLLLFRYVDSQPTTVAKEDEDKGMRNVAIVNEDNGFQNESEPETLVLGEDITSLVNERDRYSWSVVNRSAAEQGFSSEQYDAIFYVPSNFSENIMSFKEESPSKAAINYVIQPNLEAKERQRVHREMANVKSEINKEMSIIYWNYVSQEVDNTREQFDKIVEKEIAFQDAMHSFYAPSSKTLANEIDNHKNRLENILGQTKSLNTTSVDNLNSVDEAEEKIMQFTEALEDYKEAQMNQQQLLGEFQDENKQMVADGVQNYKDTVENHLANIDEQMDQYDSPAYNQNENISQINNRIGSINEVLKNGESEFVNWDRKGKTFSDLVSLNKTFLKEYNRKIANRAKNDVLEAVKGLEKKDNSIEPPEEKAITSLNFDKLKSDVGNVQEEISELEKIIGDSIPAPIDKNTVDEDMNADNNQDDNDGKVETQEDAIIIDWDSIYERLRIVNETVEDLTTSNTANQEGWKSYIEEWKDAYEELESVKNEVSIPLVDYIFEQQENIKNDKMLSSVLEQEDMDKLVGSFLEKGNLKNKSIESLASYSNELTKFANHLNERSNIENKMVEQLLTNETMREELADFYNLDDKFKEDLQELFEDLLGEEDEQGKVGELEEEFDGLVEKTNSFIDEYDNLVAKEFKQINNTMKEMKEEANLITEQIHEVNEKTFEWEESPSLEYLDGQMVFQFQQNTSSGLENLSDLVASLDENQGNITEETEELQAQVDSVQDESDELNNRWSTNVATTEQYRDDVHGVLDNTMVDGQTNPLVYDYLSNPVNVEGQTDGQVLSETEDRMPPVVLFIIILLSGLLIGFLTQYYSGNSYLVQGGLFLLLNIAVGLIISIYGLNIYPLDDSQAIMWSAFTILLLMACSNIIRGGLFVSPFVGWMASLLMIIFFISPLLNIVVPEFSFNNPVSNVYMGLMYGESSSYTLTMIMLAIVILLISGLIYGLQIMKNKHKVDETDESEVA